MFDKRIIFVVLASVILASAAFPSIGAAERYPSSGLKAPEQLTQKEWTSIREQVRMAQYQFTWQSQNGKDPAYRAPNRAQGFDIAVAPSGFSASGKDWWFGLALTEYGSNKIKPSSDKKNIRADKEKAECRKSPGVGEWYRNTPEGVEHGFTLNAPPSPGAKKIVLAFAMDTNLNPSLAADGQTLILREPKAGGPVALRYDSLVVTDATGRRLGSRMMLPAANRLELVIDSAGAIFPVTVDPLLHTEIAILHAPDMQANDWFGYSVSVSGDTLVVGAYAEDGGAGDPASYAGAAYVFTRNHGGADNWGEVKIIRASDMQLGDQFGFSVSISGDTLVVGACSEDGGAGDPLSLAGAVYVFSRNQGGADNWGQVKILHASDMQLGDQFGYSVSVSGDTLAVGAHQENGGAGDPATDSGAAYVFSRNQGGADNWGEVKTLHASDMQAFDRFGGSVSISGDTLAVGAYEENGGAGDPITMAGATYVFSRNQGGADNWGEVKILRASDMQALDLFGYSVSVSGDTLAVGAYSEDGGAGDPATGAGAAYLFSRNQGGADNWGEVKILHASDMQVNDIFGVSVSISGETLVVGASNESGGGVSSGAAYVFSRNQGGADNWGEVNILHASDMQANDNFGNSVSVSGDTLVVGAYGEDGGTGDPAFGAGAAYTFVLEDGQWRQQNNLHASDMQANDHFGNSASISGDTLVVGAPYENGGAGDPASSAGAAYVFSRNQGGADNWGEVKILRASDMQVGDDFGYSVSISGDTLVVGAYSENGGAGDPATDSGAVYIFSRNQGGADNWGQLKILHASDMQAVDLFGVSVSISGDTLVAGARGEKGGAGDPASSAGAAYVFSRNQGGADNWGEVKILHASDMRAGDYFGISVSISGDTVVIGAIDEDGGAGNPAIDAGAAYIFSRNHGGADNWGEVKVLHASDMQAGDCFGISVSISGETLVVGAYGEGGGTGNPATSAGAAYVFSRNHGGADNWGEVKILHASDMQADDYFGNSVNISGDTLVVGASYEDGGAGNPASMAGAAYVFTRNQGGGDNWGEVKVLHASDMQVSDLFSISVSLSGDTLVIGARNENGGAGDPVSGAGAAYIYRLSPACAAPSGLTNNTATDLDACAGAGVRVAWSQDAADWGDGDSGTRTYDILRDAVAIQTGIAYGTTEYDDTTGVIGTSYTYSVRYNNGCGMNAATAGASAADADGTPTAPTAGNNGPICAGATLNLTASTISGAAYEWTGPDGFTSALQNPSIANATTAATGTYSVTVAVSGCTSSAGTTNATVNAIPSAPTAGNNGPICAGATLNLTASTISGATYSWTGPNGFTSALQNPSITNATTAATGTYSVTATVSGCTSSAGTTNATVNAIPSVPTAGNNGPICAGATLNLTASTVSGATYSWTGPNGFTSALQNPSITNATTAATGTYSVTATVSGCTSPAGTTNATVNAIPSAPTAGNNGPICAGATLNLTASTVSGATYSWTGPNGFTSALQNPSITNATTAATGTYSVTATVSGCTSTAGTTTATVNAVPSAPVITAVTDDSPCTQGVLTITFTAGSPATRHDLYRDGVLVVSGVSSPIGYNPGDTSSHSYVVRAVNINDTCFADSAAVSAADANGTPTQPVITGIIDVNAFSFGLVINYTPGSPATRHDLYRDGALVVTGFVSGGTYNGLNNQPHSYSILAVNGSCSTMSNAVTAVDRGSKLVPRPRLPLEPIPFPR